MRVNRQSLSEILGISKPTITAWLDDGLPFTVQGSKGKEWEFETSEVIEWYAAHKFKRRDGRAKSGSDPKTNPFADLNGIEAETIDQANLRKESALADKHEIAAAKEAGTLVPIEDVAAIVLEENARAKSRLMSIPNELRPVLLTHLKNDRKATEQCVARVEEVIVEALSEVQSYAEVPVDEDES